MAMIIDSEGNYVPTEVLGQNHICFETKQGETYTVTGFPKELEVPETLQGLEAVRMDDSTLVYEPS